MRAARAATSRFFDMTTVAATSLLLHGLALVARRGLPVTSRSASPRLLSDAAPPSIAECVEASFVPAVMGVARGDVTEMKLFIAAAQAASRTSAPIDELCATMDALPVQTAGRPLAPEEAALRKQWVALVYLTLERLAAESGDDAAVETALVSTELRAAHEDMVTRLIRSKREAVPLSELNLDELVQSENGRSATEEALLRQAMRVVYLTLDNLESEEAAGTRADAAKPFIPGTG